MDPILLGGLLALGTSLASELVSYVAKLLAGGPLQGQAAFIITLGLSLVGGVIFYAIQVSSFDLAHVVAVASSIFGTSQIIFSWFVKNSVIHVSDQ